MSSRIYKSHEYDLEMPKKKQARKVIFAKHFEKFENAKKGKLQKYDKKMTN